MLLWIIGRLDMNIGLEDRNCPLTDSISRKAFYLKEVSRPRSELAQLIKLFKTVPAKRLNSFLRRRMKKVRIFHSFLMKRTFT